MAAAASRPNASERARQRFAEIESMSSQHQRSEAVTEALREAASLVVAAAASRSRSLSREAFEYQSVLRNCFSTLTAPPRPETPPPCCGLCGTSTDEADLRRCRPENLANEPGERRCQALLCVDCIRRHLNTSGPATCETCIESNPRGSVHEHGRLIIAAWREVLEFYTRRIYVTIGSVPFVVKLLTPG